MKIDTVEGEVEVDPGDRFFLNGIVWYVIAFKDAICLTCLRPLEGDKILVVCRMVGVIPGSLGLASVSGYVEGGLQELYSRTVAAAVKLHRSYDQGKTK